MFKRTLVTQEGLKKIQSELKELKGVKRSEIAERIQSAKELGDLSENAEYHAAREEQSFIEGKIQELEALIKSADVALPSKGSHEVTIGSMVSVTKNDGSQARYQIVGATEADPAQGKISFESPLGTALLGKTQDDTVSVSTPTGTQITYTITAVE